MDLISYSFCESGIQLGLCCSIKGTHAGVFSRCICQFGNLKQIHSQLFWSPGRDGWEPGLGWKSELLWDSKPYVSTCSPQYGKSQSSQTLKAQGPKRECPREEEEAAGVSSLGPETGISSPLLHSSGLSSPRAHLDTRSRDRSQLPIKRTARDLCSSFICYSDFFLLM